MAKSLTKQIKYAGYAYIIARETYNRSIGIYRCDKKISEEKLCDKQCEKCQAYYFSTD